MPHTTAISQQPAESVSQPASQPATQPASAAAGGISQPTPTTGGISQPASQPASQRGGRRNQPVMPQTTCRSRRPAESATSPSGGRRNQPKLPAGGRRNQPETCPAAGGKQLRPQDAPPLKQAASISFAEDVHVLHRRQITGRRSQAIWSWNLVSVSLAHFAGGKIGQDSLSCKFLSGVCMKVKFQS